MEEKLDSIIKTLSGIQSQLQNLSTAVAETQRSLSLNGNDMQRNFKILDNRITEELAAAVEQITKNK